MRVRLTAAALGAAAVLALTAALPAGAAGDPTCSELMGVAVHGQHVIGDYVTGSGMDIAWPPRRGVIGRTIAGEGVAVAGGPGPGFHFPNGVAPGASFCTGSASPGAHP